MPSTRALLAANKFRLFYSFAALCSPQCIESCIKKLKDLNKPFKYIVTAVLMQKNGAGLHTATSCYWDNTTDGAPLGCYKGAGRRSERVTCVRTGPKGRAVGLS